MRKSIEQMQAEQIIASLLKDNSVAEVLKLAHHYRESKQYAIAQRVTVAVLLCTIWDFYEDFTEENLKDLYQQYLAYYKSFDEKHEDIFAQMRAINEMLDGDLLEGKLFDAVRSEG